MAERRSLKTDVLKTDVLKTDVLIIGGGIVGTSAAIALRRRGMSVVLLERDLCGARSSGINFGGVRRQGRAFGQLPLAQRAHRIWQSLPALLGTDGEYVRSGHLKFARTAEDFGKLERYRDGAAAYGLDLELIGAAALRDRFPWVGEGLAGASLSPEDGQANPRLVAPAFARAARDAGTVIREREEVVDVGRTHNGFHASTASGLTVHAASLLNCAGAWAAPLAARFGDIVPLTQGHPAMAVTEPMPYFLPLSLGIEGGDIYCRQVARGNVVFGGGRVEPGEGGVDAIRSTTSALFRQMRSLAALVPRLEHAQIIRTWSGIEGYLPDRQPVLCASPGTPGLFHGFGFSGAGFEIGPAAGEVLAELVVDGQTPTPIETFDLRRFAPTLPPPPPHQPLQTQQHNHAATAPTTQGAH
ncbi:NAD(P)/FAD-dependent oxidoreductase [Cupriavidus plantarum]|uniref:Glycine/D-amino acid oxidase-like deaminating enzyme n=1 Tax=Cupriavidus plantarum TaxID=942865 RepID=A0A316EMQ1_9BURK|nr:FAD-binding oxidoreductase [Cupriavidus plantarum]PWK33399.1 glycine/D-amino acid oxidase-like deaminating enzyme [Cupriavidus plantarum]